MARQHSKGAPASWELRITNSPTFSRGISPNGVRNAGAIRLGMVSTKPGAGAASESSDDLSR